jgi:hypothetical protein
MSSTNARRTSDAIGSGTMRFGLGTVFEVSDQAEEGQNWDTIGTALPAPSPSGSFFLR